MLQQLVWFLHMLCALCIIILVLLQYGKGAEMGAAMGSGASQTIFGSRGSGSFLTKLTTIFALIFAITSISLSFFINHRSEHRKLSDLIQQEEIQEEDLLPLDQDHEQKSISKFNPDLDLSENSDPEDPLLKD